MLNVIDELYSIYTREIEQFIDEWQGKIIYSIEVSLSLCVDDVASDMGALGLPATR
ncbi:hypothetical protein [Oceanimonas marisflavi]|uniref:hypothetical protein n=1 Tax=Oceanimonas marisflavi TaxID=2059724 RepID=UPI001300333F|nr:hypothetical protein [Oceanimonas marisflavi]